MKTKPKKALAIVSILVISSIFLISKYFYHPTDLALENKINITDVKATSYQSSSKIDLRFKTTKNATYMISDLNKYPIATGRSSSGKVELKRIKVNTRYVMITCQGRGKKARISLKLPNEHRVYMSSIVILPVNRGEDLIKYGYNNQKLFKLQLIHAIHESTPSGEKIVLQVKVTNYDYDLETLPNEANFSLILSTGEKIPLRLSSKYNKLNKGKSSIFKYYATSNSPLSLENVKLVFDNGNLDSPWSFYLN